MIWVALFTPSPALKQNLGVGAAGEDLGTHVAEKGKALPPAMLSLLRRHLASPRGHPEALKMAKGYYLSGYQIRGRPVISPSGRYVVI